MSVELLPKIPAKRYFTLGEVCHYVGIDAADLKEWEAVFCELTPRRAGLNRRIYQHHELILLRRLRRLLNEESFTVAGLKRRLRDENELTPEEVRQNLAEILKTLS